MIFRIKNPDKKFIEILTNSISRKGLTVYTKDNGGYGVQNLEEKDQEMLSNMVAQLCDHHGVEYEIVN